MMTNRSVLKIIPQKWLALKSNVTNQMVPMSFNRGSNRCTGDSVGKYWPMVMSLNMRRPPSEPLGSFGEPLLPYRRLRPGRFLCP